LHEPLTNLIVSSGEIFGIKQYNTLVNSFIKSEKSISNYCLSLDLNDFIYSYRLLAFI
jgi:hypothetical protein